MKGIKGSISDKIYIVWAYILIKAAVGSEAAFDCSQRLKAKLFIEMPGRSVCFYHCVELQNSEAVRGSGFNAVFHKLFTYVHIS